MTHDEATDLAKRIINCWRGGPPLGEWIDELERMDAGTAGTTYARLRRTSEHAPSIAKFYAEYNSMNTHDGGTKQPDCAWCDNTGWTSTPQHVAMGHPYSGVQPCTHCNEGRAREVSEAWTKAPERKFITEAEAERLIRAHKGEP